MIALYENNKNLLKIAFWHELCFYLYVEYCIQCASLFEYLFYDKKTVIMESKEE